jgi:hypothetical protein
MRVCIFHICLFFVFTIFIQSGCKKNKQPETVTINGMTFGCRVDGNVFIADKWDFGNNIPPIRIDFLYDFLTGKIKLKTIAERQDEYIELYINGPLTPGIRELKNNTRPYPTHANAKDYGLYQVNLNVGGEYITKQTIGGYVEIITIDTIAQKVHAKFEFTGTDSVTNKQVKVTNGVFKNY